MWARTKFQDSGRCVNIKHFFKKKTQVNNSMCYSKRTHVFWYDNRGVSVRSRLCLWKCFDTFTQSVR